ncbi:MAG: hypothetical protein KatS3mg015_2096 [Fimbriimonadales bacterium]|nr:MAG: hypothetical protein KatS3mg015_2096 [Fimbriimonadales bacterium]
MEGQEGVYPLRVIRADSFDQSPDGREVHATGVVFEYRGYRVSAGEALGDLDTQVFALRGNVNVLGQNEVVRGDTVIVNFDARTFRVESGDVDLRKALFEKRVLTDLYLKAHEVQGDEELVTAESCSLTGCEYDHPHYAFAARKVTVIPDRKVVFDRVAVKALGRTLFTLPKFEIPLQRRTGGLAPDVGRNETEGFYAKFRYGFPIGQDSGVARLDITSKRGLGGGVLYDYASRFSKGYLQLHSDFNRNAGTLSFTATAQHQQRIGSVQFEGRHESSQFSYLTGLNTQTHRTTASLTLLGQPTGTTRLVLGRTENRSSFSNTTTLTATLADQRRIGTRFQSQASLSLFDTNSRSGSFIVERQALDARVSASYDFKEAIGELTYNQNIPIGATQNFASGIESVPVVTFRSDKNRLFGPSKHLPNFNLVFSAGNYKDNFAQRQVGRYFFDIQTSGGKQAPKGWLYQYSAGLTQGFYSDDTAQYVPSFNGSIGFRFTERTQTTLRYSYRRQHGFTPLTFDRTGSFHVASLDTLNEVLPGLRVGGQVGFDFNRDRQGDIAWQSPAVRLEYEPNETVRFRALSQYIPERHEWSTLRLDFSGKWNDLRIGATGRYDGIRHKWGSLNLFVDGLTIGRLRFATLLRYNGYLSRFDAAHFSFIYDLHCTEVILQVLQTNTGFRPGTEILFLIRLKALPFSSPFGIGRSGQPLDLGTGGF